MLVYEIMLLPTQWCVGLLGDVMKIIKSYRDAAYSAALATDTVVDSAKFVHGQCPTFLDDAPEEVVNELNEGFMLRYSETHPSKTYCRIDGNVVENAKGKEKIEVSIYFAMSTPLRRLGLCGMKTRRCMPLSRGGVTRGQSIGRIATAI
jgi:hypothetical protein